VSGPRLDLRAGQLQWYVRKAAACVAVGLVPAGWQLVHRAWGVEDLTAPALWALLLSGIAAYYLRAAFGWVSLEPDGLHTSRLVRGRLHRWSDIAELDTRTWYGKGTYVTVALVRSRSGHTYYLPAPRTTTSTTQGTFDRQFRSLRRRLRRHA
jgi:hypothetical protein